jgi:hypothetical protein
MSFVFTGRDVVAKFRDGARTGEKEVYEITFAEASFELSRLQEYVPIMVRGTVDHFRRMNSMHALGQLSWRYSDKDITDFVRKFLTGKSTSTETIEYCLSPNDYNDAFWSKNNIIEPIGDNGIAPDGSSIAQRLVPVGGGIGSIETTVTVEVDIGEFVYFDFWSKAEVEHVAACAAAITANGGGFPPEGYLHWYRTRTYWQKITGGLNNQSATKVPEQFTCWIYTSHVNPGYSHDVWGVSIRREKAATKTWDLTLDIYKDGSLERRIFLEHVAYENIGFNEDPDGSLWSLDLLSRKEKPFEILY